MNRIHTFIALLALSGSTVCAQLDPGNPLSGLEKLKDFRTMRASSTDPNWRNGNGDCRWIRAGGSLTLAELKGPGEIVHFWCTIADQEPNYSRLLTLRIYWDGETNASVECPIGDFFGMGMGVDKAFTSLPVRVSSDGRGRNCYWPMPFRKSARIVVTNDGKKPCDAFYYYIDWQKLKSLPDDSACFHAMYRQEFPCVMGQNYLIADIQGRGQYVGTVLSVYLTSPGWFGEGNDYFFIDGEKEPSLRGTGTEDYFCDGWGFREQSGPFYGTPLWEGYDTGDRGSAYRWHIPDPVTFKQSLRVEIQHRGYQKFPDGKETGYIERDDLMSSVAFWYQTGPHKPYPPLPPGPERLPFRDRILLKGYTAVATAKHSDDPIEVQPLDGVTDGKQLWFHPHTDKGWVEVSFESPTSQSIELTVKMVHSYDYGIYRVLLDGEQIALLDLYDPDIVPTAEKLGMHKLAAGTHTLRFECVGKSPKSAGYFLGFDALAERVSAYVRPPGFDLRTLQKRK
ncbi:MAG TPA: glycoside hydrolase family 172 protein [Candidatus Limnocylindrales bacterium]|nr:glycoside hydrolase family 172 protein [Candidatus Limnocylindrales bacterium]